MDVSLFGVMIDGSVTERCESKMIKEPVPGAYRHRPDVRIVTAAGALPCSPSSTLDSVPESWEGMTQSSVSTRCGIGLPALKIPNSHLTLFGSA